MRDWLFGRRSPESARRDNFSFAPVTMNDWQVLDRANRLLIRYSGFRLHEGRFETSIFRQATCDMPSRAETGLTSVDVGEKVHTFSMSIDRLRDQPAGYRNHDSEVLLHLPRVTYGLNVSLSLLQRSFELSTPADSMTLYLHCLVEQLHLPAWNAEFEPHLGHLRSYVDARTLRLVIDPALRSMAETLLGKDRADDILREDRLVRPVTKPIADARAGRP